MELVIADSDRRFVRSSQVLYIVDALRYFMDRVFCSIQFFRRGGFRFTGYAQVAGI